MSVSYEIHTLVQGRWQIHVRYDHDKRDEALNEATILEKDRQIESVRVVRDEFDAIENASREKIIYETGESKSSTPAPPTLGR